MAGAFGWRFILFSACFYLLLSFILVEGGKQFLTGVNYNPKGNCINGSILTTWTAATDYNETQLRNIPNGTEVTFCKDCNYGSVAEQNPLYTYWMINGTGHNETWFTPFYYDIYNKANTNETCTSWLTFVDCAAYIIKCPYFADNCNLITWINTTTSHMALANCITTVTVDNYISYLWQNPFSNIGWLSWISIAILITDVYIIVTSLIP